MYLLPLGNSRKVDINYDVLVQKLNCLLEIERTVPSLGNNNKHSNHNWRLDVSQYFVSNWQTVYLQVEKTGSVDES